MDETQRRPRLRMLSVKIEPELLDELDAVARADRRTVSYIVREAIALALAVRARQAARA